MFACFFDKSICTLLWYTFRVEIRLDPKSQEHRNGEGLKVSLEGAKSRKSTR